MRPLLRQIRWRSAELRRTLVRTVCRRFYRDTDDDPKRSVMICGTARSGTTWLAEIIDSQVPSRLMFEPFHPDLVDEFSSYRHFQYMRPEADDPRLLAYCRKVVTGKIRHPWIDRRVEHLFPKLRVIKDIRTSLFLRWIQRHFPEMPIVFVMRHPCAVVSSRLQLQWDTDRDIARLLRQPELCLDFLQDKMEVIQRAKTAEEKHAIVWCISNLVPLGQFAPGDLELIYYEHLCARPETEIPRLFETIRRPFGDRVFHSIHRPSTTTRRFSAVVTGEDRISGWRRRLSARQIDNVFKIVEQFDLSHIYGDSSMPLMGDPRGGGGDP